MLAFLGAIVIGVSLGLFGSGGSILTVPVLLYLLHMPPQLAIASSLLIVAGISLFGSVRNGLQRLVSWRHVMWFGIPGMVGTYGGAWLGTLVDARWQLLVFAVLMLLAAVMMWRSNIGEHGNGKAFKPVKIVIDGLAVGAVTGFVGVGGGFLIVPALVLLGGLSLPVGVATSLVIIAMKSFVGFAKYYWVMAAQGAVFDWNTIGLMIVAGIVGSFIGAAVSKRLPKQQLQRAFAVFIVIMAVFVIYQSVI